MIDQAARASIAFTQFMRMRSLMTFPPLSIERLPLTARLADASDGLSLSPGPSSDPRGSAVEAGRPANQSDPGSACDCPVCTSDCAGIVPCQYEEN